MQSIQIYTTEEVKKSLRVMAAMAGKTLSQYVEEILIEYVRKHSAPNAQ